MNKPPPVGRLRQPARAARPTTPAEAAPSHFRASDLRAAAQLATQATLGVVNITEGVHQSVLRTLGASNRRGPERTTGITGMVYRGVRGVTGLVGRGLDAALAGLLPSPAPGSPQHPDSPEREQALAVLNGVLGDRLAAAHNPLTLDMAFRFSASAWVPGQPLPAGTHISGHVLLTVHGLCMNDQQWLWQGHDHGAWLAEALGCTRLNLRYNSGLHISDNGQQLSELLERLVATWPVALTRLTLLTHSMGGLVARSAQAAAVRSGHTWPQRLKDLVFVGTPHHGSPLERAGHWVDTLLAATPFTAPFVRLGQLRSVGIIDLRHGHVLPQDWSGQASQPRALGRHADTRAPLPLPEGVNCFAVAATLAGQRSMLADRLVGDGLVPLHSALGQHDNPRKRLRFAPDHRRVVYRTGHLELLSSPAVARQLLAWLAPAATTPTPTPTSAPGST
ncbi:MAG: alpha/beta hydrolase [Burkholderiaceae bacterium]|nr:alpha/beta hydrolase [Burkholderiaceae bacterium]